MNYMGHARLSPLRECHNTQGRIKNQELRSFTSVSVHVSHVQEKTYCRGGKNEHFVEELYQSKVNSHEKSVESDIELTNQSNEIGTERSRSIWKHGKCHRGCHRSYRCFTAGAVGSLRPILLI